MKRHTITAPADNTLVAHPENLPHGAWQQITVVTVRSGQPRPYADSVNEYLVTFEGGTPSTREGYDLPFAIMPPYKPLELPPGATRTIIAGPTDEERVELRETEVKAVCALITREWKYEKDDPERKWHHTYLDYFDAVEIEDTHTTYRLIIVEPYCD